MLVSFGGLLTCADPLWLFAYTGLRKIAIQTFDAKGVERLKKQGMLRMPNQLLETRVIGEKSLADRQRDVTARVGKWKNARYRGIIFGQLRITFANSSRLRHAG
jgi:hypothetical protein